MTVTILPESILNLCRPDDLVLESYRSSNNYVAHTELSSQKQFPVEFRKDPPHKVWELLYYRHQSKFSISQILHNVLLLLIIIIIIISSSSSSNSNSSSSTLQAGR
jgi:hypothetical protein